MAQGACIAIEDAVVLGRTLRAVEDENVANALTCYENSRKQRTARVQIGSRGNEWLKLGGNADWVYDYEAWTAPLESMQQVAKEN